ncbi:type II toxin-antitoxin system RelE/ParE family toxin [Saccharospirillum mangrovi]|uniref:type II toxin-antitoxin system RelE/ParE family toxin n=1 Tax=Saccharospirillum mangrovi TaxID=2161747 RepID=UPI000D3960E0|nr:type II toxin-antitoxin system RelE/ParE family toxin [Saccharospirillum mangrovi]
MAEIVWTEPALQQLDDIAEYIALDKPNAAGQLVASVFEEVERLAGFPQSGRIPPELPGSVYREVVVPPCRVFYRIEATTVIILLVIREEQLFRRFMLDN